MLPRIADAVAGRAALLLDGGVRRGTDVLEALALGARAVLVGRPVLWGLAAGGRAGVAAALEALRRELDLAMALAGCPDLASAPRDLIEPWPGAEKRCASGGSQRRSGGQPGPSCREYVNLTASSPSADPAGRRSNMILICHQPIRLGAIALALSRCGDSWLRTPNGIRSDS